METKVNYAIVGLFVILLSTAFVAGILWISTGGHGRLTDYYLVYVKESVSGLSPDAPVKYKGVNVGKVKKLSIPEGRPDQVCLLLEVQIGTPIKEDTEAVLEYQGLTGIAFVNLTGGTVESPYLKATPGEEYPVIKSRPSLFARLEEKLTDPLEYLIETSSRINKLLNKKNLQNFEETLKNINSLAGSLSVYAKDLDQAVKDFSVVMADAKKASGELSGVMVEIKKASKATENMAERFAEAGESIKAEVKKGGKEFHNNTQRLFPELFQLISELKKTSANISRLTEEMERDPTILIYGNKPQRKGPGE